jgi:hypothetical protein
MLAQLLDTGNLQVLLDRGPAYERAAAQLGTSGPVEVILTPGHRAYGQIRELIESEEVRRFAELYHGPKPPEEGKWERHGTGPEGGAIWKRVPQRGHGKADVKDIHEARQAKTANAGYQELMFAKLKPIVERVATYQNALKGKGGYEAWRANSKTPDKDLKFLAGAKEVRAGIKRRNALKLADYMTKDLSRDERLRFESDATDFLADFGKEEYSSKPQAEQVAAILQDKWADTSSDKDPLARAIQSRAETLFGLEDAWSNDSKAGVTPLLQKTMKIIRDHRAVIDAYLKAVYQRTQDTLAAAGVEEMVLYRGMTVDPRDAGAFRQGKDVALVHDVPMKLQPLSSFTESFETAAQFANAAEDDDIDNSVIMAVRVPRQRIFSTAITGPGCLEETEAIILGGPLRALVLAFNADAEPPEEEDFYR